MIFKRYTLWLLFISFSISVAVAQNEVETSSIIQVGENVNRGQSMQLLTNIFELQSSDELKIRGQKSDNIGFMHDTYHQYYKDRRVEGGVLKVHSKNGEIQTISGQFMDIFMDINAFPTLSEPAAFQRAKIAVGAQEYIWDTDGGSTPGYDLVIYADPKGKFAPKLAYKFEIHAVTPDFLSDVFIDAHTGQHIASHNKIHETDTPVTGNSLYEGIVNVTGDFTGSLYRLRQTTDGDGVETYDLQGGQEPNEGVDITSPTADFGNTQQTGIQAQYGMEQSHRYFLMKHGRNSYDGSGAVLRMYIGWGNNVANAQWRGNHMRFGNGNGTTVLPLVTLDILAHELAHGVTQETANLVYQNESGALNESFSDIFGEAVENFVRGDNNWLMGDESFVAAGGIRSMANPNDFGDPDTYLGDLWFTGSGDNGGVHINSGVQNKWFYILCEGEAGTNDFGNIYNVPAIGMEKAAKIAYRNLSQYLSVFSQYPDARDGAIQAAIDLYGEDSPEVIATTNAWYAVGVGDAYIDPSDDIPPSVPGNLTANNTTPTSTELSWTASTDNQGLANYRIYINGNLDGTTTSLNYTTNSLSPNTLHNIEVVAVDVADNESDPATIEVITPAIGYCNAKGENSDSEWIASVNIGSFSNSSGNNGGYADFTNLVITVTPGQSTNFTLTPGHSGSAFPEYWMAWIDYNKDGDFTDLGEIVINSGSGQTTPYSGSFTTPGNVTGNTRMRIAMKWNTIPGSCESFPYGEVEDYIISFDGSGGGGDTEAPSTPGNLTASNTTTNSTDLSWNASTDNVGVTGYRVYVNGNLDGTTTGLNYTVNGLSPNTTYNVTVTAIDAAGNESSPAATSVTTENSSDNQAPSTPGNLTASNTTTNSTDLSWNASTDNVGVTGYRVYVNGNLDGTTTGLNYTVNGLSPNTTYNITVTAIDAAGNESSPAATSVTTEDDVTPPVNYCSSSGNNASDEWIANVSIGSFNNSSESNGGYADFTSQVINLTAGQSYNVSLTPDYSGTEYPEWWRIWIDYNGDGDFTDSGELVYDSGSATSGTVNGNITIPGNASGTTRMRVSMRWNEAADPCGTFNFGEVEDYSVSFGGGGGGDTQAPSTPGNLTASNTTTNSTDLSWNASTDNVGVTGYRVYVNGGLDGTTAGLNYTVNGLSPNTTYNINVTAIDAANNESAPASTSVTTDDDGGGPVNYCSSSGNNASDEWIANVSIGTFNNSSGSNGGYGDFTSQTINLNAGQSYPITLTPDYDGTNYPERWRIWVDFNGDGDFDDGGEQIFDSGSAISGQVSGNINIPGNATGSTRMRISMRWNAAPDPCGTFNFGEVEDYTVAFGSALQFSPTSGIENTRNIPTTVLGRPNKGADNTISGERYLGLSIYPNPVIDQMKVKLPLEIKVMRILSANGSLVQEINTAENTDLIDVSNLGAGVYYLYVQTADKVYTDRFIKK